MPARGSLSYLIEMIDNKSVELNRRSRLTNIWQDTVFFKLVFLSWESHFSFYSMESLNHGNIALY